jgi:ribosome-associated protein
MPEANEKRGYPERDGGAPRKLRLDQFLKLTGLAATGGQAKHRIQSGEVRVNGEVEHRRGRGLQPGDRVSIDGQVHVVRSDLWDPPQPRHP